VLGLPSSGQQRRRAAEKQRWRRFNLIGGFLLLAALAQLATLLVRDNQPTRAGAESQEPNPSSQPEKLAAKSTPAVRPVPEGSIFDDFRGGLGAWTVNNATLESGAVRLGDPTSKRGGKGFLIRKVSGFNGDFTVSLDWTQLGKTKGWWDYLILVFREDKVKLLERAGDWSAQWPGGGTGGPLPGGKELAAGRRIFKIRRAGIRFTFSTTRAGQESILVKKELAALGELTSVEVRTSNSFEPLHAVVETFRLSTDKAASPP
jgi:hypothetical protein